MATATAKKKPLDTPPVFLWEGVDKRGKVMKGEMTGRNEGLVKAELRLPEGACTYPLRDRALSGEEW